MVCFCRFRLFCLFRRFADATILDVVDFRGECQKKDDRLPHTLPTDKGEFSRHFLGGVLTPVVVPDGIDDEVFEGPASSERARFRKTGKTLERVNVFLRRVQSAKHDVF